MGLARDDWNSLYTDAVETIWREERVELRKAAMIVHILGLELARVKEVAQFELNYYREQFVLLDNLKADQLYLKSTTPRNHKPGAVTPLVIPKVEKFSSESYTSPDLFRWDSPESKTSADTTLLTGSDNGDSDALLSTQGNKSPKICRRRRYYNIKRAKANTIIQTQKKSPVNNTVKSPVIVKHEISPNKVFEDIILATPEPAKKPKCRNVSTMKSQSRKKKKLVNNTLTQIYPELTVKLCEKKSDDSDATLIHDVAQLDEMKVDEIINMIGGDKENDSEKELRVITYNYDFPYGDKPISTEKKKSKCEKCLKRNAKCPEHKILSESYNNTFTGFWDVDFTVKDPHDSADSTIF